MSDDRVQKLLQGALKAARSGQMELAQRAFREALKIDPRNETAWVGLATITESEPDKLRILKKVLELNPQNAQAQQMLARLLPAEEPPLPDTASEAQDVELEMPSLDDLRIADEPAAAVDEAPSGGVRSLRSLRQSEAEPADLPQETPVAPAFSAAGLIDIEAMTIEDAFAHLPQPPPGEDGVPMPRDEGALNALAHEAQQMIAEALASSSKSNITWEKKDSGRAGEWEYRRFVFQVGAAITIFVVILVAAGTLLILSTPQAQAVLFEPTVTSSATTTPTSTATPGLTNTPSPTPSQSATPQPTLPITITPENDDPNFPPAPTEVYFSGDSVDILVEQAIVLMDQGQYNEAFNILREEATFALSSGEFAPAYFLSELYLRRDGNPEDAEAVLQEWLTEWEGSARESDVQPQLLVAQARIELFRAEGLLANGDEEALEQAEELLQSAEEKLQDVVNFQDANFPEAYILLAERYLLVDEPTTAIDLLDTAILENMYGSPELRLEIARLLVAQGDYGEALYELNTLLEIHPWDQAALAYQPEVALLANQPGLAVLYSEQYLLYYPGSATAWYWLGRAREAENKDSLALNAYARGLQAGENDPGTLLILPQRAELYARLGDYDAALDDLAAALERTDDPAILLRRSELAAEAGDYDLALEDLQDLSRSDVLPDAVRLLREADLLLARGDEGDLEEALEITSELAADETLPEELRPAVQETLARIAFQQEDYNAALAALQGDDGDVIAIERTPNLRYLLAQIYQARAVQTGATADFEAALREYEWLLTLGQVVPYPFLDDVQMRYEEIVTRLGGR